MLIALASLFLLTGISHQSTIFGVDFPIDAPDQPIPTSWTLPDAFKPQPAQVPSPRPEYADESPWFALYLMVQAGTLQGCVQEAESGAKMTFARASSFNYSQMASGETGGNTREEARRICLGYGLLFNCTDLQAVKTVNRTSENRKSLAIYSAFMLEYWLERKLPAVNEARCAPVGMHAHLSKHLEFNRNEPTWGPTEKSKPLSGASIAGIVFGLLAVISATVLVIYCLAKGKPSAGEKEESAKMDQKGVGKKKDSKTGVASAPGAQVVTEEGVV